MRLARLLSTFLKFFKSFFFRTAVVGVEGLLVLFGFEVPLCVVAAGPDPGLAPETMDKPLQLGALW